MKQTWVISIRIKYCLSSSITDHVQSYLEWDLRESHDPTTTTDPKPFVMHFSLAEICFPSGTANLLQSRTESREINYCKRAESIPSQFQYYFTIIYQQS